MRLILLALYFTCEGFYARAAETNSFPFSFDRLRQQAAKLAESAYAPPSRPVPDFLGKLSYDEYQVIHFRPGSGPWSAENLRFDVGFMHRGFLFKDPVAIHLLESGQARRWDFSPSQFDYGKLNLASPIPAGIDFAGFKILFTNQMARKWDEVASFLGASYFRLVGTRQHYGASGRVLAVDTGAPAGEEFPRLTQFWVERPASLSDQVQVFGLLDSPSAAGACRFLITAGEETSADVEICLYPRVTNKKFGFAPLTSMFLTGENRTRYIPDFRPEVHDSDGLLISSANGWEWRPLENPIRVHRITRYSPRGVKGFGLLQRDRAFENYQDLAGRYEMRPSLWVDLIGTNWTGAVELVEIPTPNEYHDNIVAYWVPDQPLDAGKETRYRYRISALSKQPEAPLAKVTSTRINPAQENRPARFIIDFAEMPLEGKDPPGKVQARAAPSRGAIKNLVTEPNAMTGGWRAFFDWEGAGHEPVELRLTLMAGERAISETWIYAPSLP